MSTDRHFTTAWIEPLGMLCYRRPWAALAMAAAVSAAGLLYAARHLEIETSRDELVRKDAPFQLDARRYDREFPNTTSLIVAVEPSTLAQGERFVDELAARLIESKDVARQVFYRFKPEDLGGRALLYLPLDQLQKLVSAAGDNAELLSRFLEAPSLDALLRLLNRKISEGMVSHLVGGLFAGIGIHSHGQAAFVRV